MIFHIASGGVFFTGVACLVLAALLGACARARLRQTATTVCIIGQTFQRATSPHRLILLETRRSAINPHLRACRQISRFGASFGPLVLRHS